MYLLILIHKERGPYSPLQETRKREFYEKPSVKRKRKSEAARKRKKF